MFTFWTGSSVPRYCVFVQRFRTTQQWLFDVEVYQGLYAADRKVLRSKVVQEKNWIM